MTARPLVDPITAHVWCDMRGEVHASWPVFPCPGWHRPLYVARQNVDEARARRGDPDTSVVAAVSVAGLPVSRRAVYDCLTRVVGAVTDEELGLDYRSLRVKFGWPPQTPQGIRSRRAELVRAGLVVDTGERRATLAGRAATVWATRPEVTP